MTLEELRICQIGGLIGEAPHPCLYFEWTGENTQTVKKAWLTTDEQVQAIEQKENFRKWASREDLSELMEEFRRIKFGISKEKYEEAKQKMRKDRE